MDSKVIQKKEKTAQAVNRSSLPRRSSPVESTEAVSPRMPRVEATNLSLTEIHPEGFFPAEGPLRKTASLNLWFGQFPFQVAPKVPPTK